MADLLQDRFFLLIIAGVLGAVFGSFATALIYRWPRNINWVSQRSICPKCNHALGVFDLLPVFSYLLSGGRCRYCKTRYGATYLMIEIIMIVTFVLSAYLFGPSVKTVVVSLLGFSTIIIFAVDFEHYIIPDEINLFMFVTGIIYSFYNDVPLEQIIIMPIAFFAFAMFLRYLMLFWKKKEGLGLGDVKFFIAAGTFLSVGQLPAFLFFSGFVGIIIAIIWKILKKGDIFPFGPALAISLLFCVAFPETSLNLIAFVQEIIY